jgi:hypothetical protein
VSIHFSNEYEEARTVFLKAAHSAETRSMQILPGLFIDAALYGNPDRRDLLIIASGTHGIEGFIGNAIQQLFIEKHLHHFKQHTSLALIHAINPYGMKYGRRNNEHNVDLNRAFLKHKHEYCDDNHGALEIFRKMTTRLFREAPRRSHRYEKCFFYVNAILFALRYGLLKSRQALAGGQYTFPKSLAFGGLINNQFETSVTVYQSLLEELSRHRRNLIFIDLHTGLAVTRYMAEHSRNSEEFRKWRDIHPGSQAMVKDKSMPDNTILVNRKGTIGLYTAEASQAKNNYCMCIDFSTGKRGQFDIGFTAVSENQVFHYGAVREKFRKEVEHNFRELLYPSPLHVRKRILNEADEFFSRLYKGFYNGEDVLQHLYRDKATGP